MQELPYISESTFLPLALIAVVLDYSRLRVTQCETHAAQEWVTIQPHACAIDCSAPCRRVDNEGVLRVGESWSTVGMRDREYAIRAHRVELSTLAELTRGAEHILGIITIFDRCEGQWRRRTSRPVVEWKGSVGSLAFGATAPFDRCVWRLLSDRAALDRDDIELHGLVVVANVLRFMLVRVWTENLPPTWLDEELSAFPLFSDPAHYVPYFLVVHFESLPEDDPLFYVEDD